MADGWKKAADLRRKVAQDEWKSATRVCLPAIFIFVCDLQHFEITPARRKRALELLVDPPKKLFKGKECVDYAAVADQLISQVVVTLFRDHVWVRRMSGRWTHYIN